MRIAKGILCPQCGRECSAIVLVQPLGPGKEGCHGQGYCSDLCFNIHLKHPFETKQKPTINLLAETSKGPLISLDECSSRQQAEKVGLFNFLRAMAQTDVIQSLISDNNKLARFHALQNADEVKGLTDLAFAIDTVKMSLRLPLEPARAEFIVKRLQEIIEDAKDRLIAEDGDLVFDQAERVEREIIHAIVKNTIETILELGSDHPRYRFSPKKLNSRMAEETIFDLSSGSENDIPFEMAEGACVHFQDIDDEVLQTVMITVAENGGGQHRFRIQTHRDDAAGPFLEKLADIIKAEELYSSPEFVFVERRLDVDEHDIDSYISCLRVVPFHERVKNVIDHKLHISRNIASKTVFKPETHTVIHLHFKKESFMQELNFFANLENTEELPLFEHQVSAHLCRLFLPPGCPPLIALKLVRGREKLACLKDLFAGRQKDSKIVSIEVSGNDLVFNGQYEEHLYTKLELEFYDSFKNEVKSDRFMQSLAFCAGIEIADAKQHLELLLVDKELDKRPSPQADLLRVYRCLRIVRILESGYDLLNLHPLSFALGLRLGEPKKIFPIFRALGRPTPPPLTFRLLEHALHPSEGRCLIQLLGTEKLPKILCIRYEAGSRGIDLLTLLAKAEIEINTRTSYELKAILQTEFDPRGFCTSVTLCGDSITNKSAFSRMKGLLLENKPPKTLVLIFELKTSWLRLEQFTAN